MEVRARQSADNHRLSITQQFKALNANNILALEINEVLQATIDKLTLQLSTKQTMLTLW